jgi:long-chain fatty acid transport protein
VWTLTFSANDASCSEPQDKPSAKAPAPEPIIQPPVIKPSRFFSSDHFHNPLQQWQEKQGKLKPGSTSQKKEESMRKWLISIGVLFLIAGLASALQAGGIINKQNLSAEYIRTLNRNAATDMADAAAFNPAGTAMMLDGLYLKADAIYLAKDYSNKMPSAPPFNLGTLDSDEPSIIPGLFAIYKQNRWSAFFAVTIPGGGGKVDFEDGNARTAVLAASLGPFIGATPLAADQALEADSFYVGYSLGGAYKIFDSLSIGGGIRFVDAYQEFKGHAAGALRRVDVEIEREDEAFNYFLGLNYAPIKDLNIGLTYMSNTPLNFKSDTTDTSPGAAISTAVGWVDGTHEREDLPGYLALGVSYFIIPNTLRIEPNLTYYLEKAAKLEGERFHNAGNSYDVGATVEYIFNPQWRVSLGYMHTDIRGMKPDELLPEAPELDANTIALGLVWSPWDRLSVTLSGLKVWYDSEKKEITNGRGPAGTELEKDVWGVALGLQYRFF